MRRNPRQLLPRSQVRLWPVRLAVAAFCAATPAQAQRVIHVDAGATAGGDGTSWPDAYADLQDALDDARTLGGCPCEIWVAEGTYKPDRGTGDRTLAFELVNGVAFYGGFSGGEQRRTECDPLSHETILSGDLGGDDAPNTAPGSACCSPFQWCDDDECRSAVEAQDQSCAILWRPRCADYAVSLCCNLCRPTRCDNSFNVVRAVDTDSTALLDGFTIQSGEALGDLFEQGGGLNCQDSSARVRNCTFKDNNAWAGAAVSTYFGQPTITDTRFFQNGSELTRSFALEASGGVLDSFGIKNCTFLSNKGSGAIVTYAHENTIEGCRFIGNSGGGVVSLGTCDVISCSFIGNQRSAIWSQNNLWVIGSEFIGNWDHDSGGGIDMAGGYATVFNSIFSGNVAGGRDGYPGGAGAFGGNGLDIFVNCTFINNHAGSVGGIASEGALLENCILWGNSDDYGTGVYSQLYVGPAYSQVNYSVVQGWEGEFSGIATSSVNPLIIDALGPDGVAGTADDDLRLSPDSPAINAGDPDFLPSAGETDVDGHARILCDRIDIGAYEFGIGDYDCDRTVNLTDFSAWHDCMTGPSTSPPTPPIPSACAAFDFDSDGAIDLLDLRVWMNLLPAP